MPIHSLKRQTLKGKRDCPESEEVAKDGSGRTSQEQGQGELRDGDRQQNEEEKKTVHPYKGAFVDFTG